MNMPGHDQPDGDTVGEHLPTPAVYQPWLDGGPIIKPGLRRLGADTGQESADERVFQLDQDWRRYQDAKAAVRQGAFHRCVGVDRLSAQTLAAAVRWVGLRLSAEWPGMFSYADEGEVWTLECGLSGDRLAFDGDGLLKAAGDSRWDAGVGSGNPPVGRPAALGSRDVPGVQEGLEAQVRAVDGLAVQVQEDFCIMQRRGDQHWLATVHVCLPSHWEPAAKLGCHFAGIHAAVPEMEAINSRQAAWVDQMIMSDPPTVRFVWGAQWDDQLCRLPGLSPMASTMPKPAMPEQAMSQHAISGQAAPLHIRVERQVIVGLPDVDASLFLIRPYVMPAASLSAESRTALANRAASMSPELRAYKGLGDARMWRAAMDQLRRGECS